MNPVLSTRTVLDTDGTRYLHHLLWCPGCENVHAPSTRLPETPADKQPMWDWDRNTTAPTFSPSYLTWSGDKDNPTSRCHSFVRGGQWEFLGDCTHALAGQTVPLPPLPDWLVATDVP